MNWIDIIIVVALAWAVWNGWQRGMTLQICTLAGIIAGVWVAARYGFQLGQALQVPFEFASATGFAILFLGVIIIVALISRGLRRIFNFAGLGSLDIALGVLFSCIKMLIILGGALWAFDLLNGDAHRIVPAETLEGSKLYRPILGIADRIMPMLNGVTDSIRNAL